MPSWNYDNQAATALGMLLFVAIANALNSTMPEILSQYAAVFRTLFGAGLVSGIYQLGITGIYWICVFLISGVVRLRDKSQLPKRPVRLPPGGIYTLVGYLLLLVFLAALVLWKTS
jgi:hypothetical protein